jgi:hypothetical protein
LGEKKGMQTEKLVVKNQHTRVAENTFAKTGRRWEL